MFLREIRKCLRLKLLRLLGSREHRGCYFRRNRRRGTVLLKNGLKINKMEQLRNEKMQIHQKMIVPGPIL